MGKPTRLITGAKAFWQKALRTDGVAKAIAAAGCDVDGLKKLTTHTAATLKTMTNARKRKLAEETLKAAVKAPRRIDAKRDSLERLGHDVVVTDLGNLRKDKRKIAFCRQCFSSRRHILLSGLKCGKGKHKNTCSNVSIVVKFETLSQHMTPTAARVPPGFPQGSPRFPPDNPPPTDFKRDLAPGFRPHSPQS